jgi:hypothetical protein
MEHDMENKAQGGVLTGLTDAEPATSGIQTAKDTQANREYKSSVLPHLITALHREREICSALLGKEIPADTDIRNVTLSDALYKGILNDLALLVGDVLLLLIEHQSSINENMALRLLLYCSRVYKSIIPQRALYHTKAITIPAPEFVVLYNGKDTLPAKQVYRLSDMFAKHGSDGEPPLELTVTVYNINDGQNTDITGRSSTLSQYVMFVAKVREYEKDGMELTEAVGAAVSHCTEHGILADYLEQYGSEVLNMLTAEWNLDTALEVRYEEGIIEGLVKGRNEERGKWQTVVADKDALIAELQRKLERGN